MGVPAHTSISASPRDWVSISSLLSSLPFPYFPFGHPPPPEHCHLYQVKSSTLSQICLLPFPDLRLLSQRLGGSGFFRVKFYANMGMGKKISCGEAHTLHRVQCSCAHASISSLQSLVGTGHFVTALLPFSFPNSTQIPF